MLKIFANIFPGARWCKLAAVLGVVIVILALAWFFSTAGYRNIKPQFKSPIGSTLRIFTFNQSQHHDPVPNCWYDSGDYVVFAPRIAASLWYLSLAYKESARPDVKNDLRLVIDQQLGCVDAMLQSGYKQFRDQDNHGINLPPVINAWVYPNRRYKFTSGEGKDVATLLSLTYQNIGNAAKTEEYKKISANLIAPTMANNCCERGILQLPANWLPALAVLSGDKDTKLATFTWGAQPIAIAKLARSNKEEIVGLFYTIDRKFKSNGSPFDYLGGNYDIAGTIALEQLYAKKFNDNSFFSLSQRLHKYLEGDNDYKVDFIHSQQIYHPCRFFGACVLGSTLVNGIDENKKWESSGQNAWRMAESQLIGQAQFVLAEVLYNRL